jgi:hypothetical protein
MAVPGVCDAGPETPPAFIADFEDGATAGWFDYNDETAGGAIQNVVAEAAGALGTSYAGHLSGTGYSTWGAGTGVPLGCLGVATFDGISFWAKGTSGTTNELMVQVVTPGTQSAEFGGDCASNCFDHFSLTVSLTAEWTQHTIPFDDLEQTGWGSAATWEDIVIGLNFATAGPDFDYWFDEIAFYSGSASTTPVGGGGGGAGGAGD